jgi:putative peptide zinc metalloprotease protein
MNLAEVLNVALPELPARRLTKRFPRLHPKLIIREQIEDGNPTMVGMISGGTFIFRFTPEQWRLLELFNGERSYAEVADLYLEQTGVAFGEEQIHEFTDSLDEGGFWYKTTYEQNITASQKLADERQRKNKRKVDLSLITFSTWDPDRYLTNLHRLIGFAYAPWFTFLTLGMFTIMTLIFVGGWSEIWRDSVQYYTFTDKGAADLAEFWLLFCGLGFFHESAHGLTCKHFGGEVHKMGFMLIYLSPAFFCDVGEVYVYGGKWPRIAAIVAGIWIELMFCSIASVVWWGTPSGSPVHDFAYKIMLITGVAVVLMNLNPLIKLDGYYLFGELIGIPTIKESSTEYLSSWFKRHVFRLPVEVPYLRRSRRGLFVGYALISGAYSYVVLLAVIRLAYNIFAHFSAQWAFLPAGVIAVLIFRVRLRSTGRFMRDFFLDKKEAIAGWSTSPRGALLEGLILVLLFAPIWHKTVAGRFIVEPEQRAVVRATVAGQVVALFTDEGMEIAAHSPIAQLQDIRLESEARTDLGMAEDRVRQSQLSYRDLGGALGERASQTERNRSVEGRMSALEIVSPISGVVVTPNLRNLVGSFVEEGRVLAEVDDLRSLKANIFLPEFEMHEVGVGASAAIKLASRFAPVRGRVTAIAPALAEVPPGVIRQEKYQGIVPPSYYVATMLIPSPLEGMTVGMTGDAKIAVRRQSVAGAVWTAAREFVQRKLW